MLRADEFSSLEWDSNPSRAQLADVLRVHDFNYVQKLGGWMCSLFLSCGCVCLCLVVSECRRAFVFFVKRQFLLTTAVSFPAGTSGKEKVLFACVFLALCPEISQAGKNISVLSGLGRRRLRHL